MKQALDAEVITDLKAAPGQIRKDKDWYVLTFLRVVKIKNFDPGTFSLNENEISCIRATMFKFDGSRLLIRGTMGEIKDIISYFDALALKLVSNTNQTEINFEQFYKIDNPNIDLGNLLSKLEQEGTISDIKKLKLREMEVTLGKIGKCIVNTSDYGAAKKVIEEEESKAHGIEINLKSPKDTSAYIDIDGQVRVTTKSEDADIYGLAIQFCNML
jgi:hypothetical protein